MTWFSHMCRLWCSLLAPIYANIMCASTCTMLHPALMVANSKRMCVHTQLQLHVVLIIHIIRFLFFCSYSLVDFQHQGKNSRDRTNLIDSRTIMWISSRWGYSPGESFMLAYPLFLVWERRPGKGQVRTWRKHLEQKIKLC
jgi:hypothetical protein